MGLPRQSQDIVYIYLLVTKFSREIIYCLRNMGQIESSKETLAITLGRKNIIGAMLRNQKNCKTILIIGIHPMYADIIYKKSLIDGQHR